MPDETIAATTRYRGANDIGFSATGEEAVLINLSTQHKYGLNETGVRIWQLVQIGASVAEMATALAEEYDVADEDARDAVSQLCAELLGEGLISMAS